MYVNLENCKAPTYYNLLSPSMTLKQGYFLFSGMLVMDFCMCVAVCLSAGTYSLISLSVLLFFTPFSQVKG